MEIYDDVFRLAEVKYGAQVQMEKTCEECAELIIALHRFGSDRCKVADVIDELADVKIMVRQMELIFNVEDRVDKRVAYKVKRLESRIGEF